jgi:hypothetical protein
LAHEVELVKDPNAHVVADRESFAYELLIRSNCHIEEAVCDLMTHARNIYVLDA